MAPRDLWFKMNPKTKKRDVPTKRHGIGSRWQVEWVDLDGNRTTATFDNKDAAELFEATVKVRKHDGTLISADKKDVRLWELWESWLDTRSTASEKTRKDYMSLWRVHIEPQWGRRKVAEIQEHQVVAWVAGLSTMKGVKAGGEPRPLSGSAKKKVADMMGSMLGHAVKLRVIAANPLDGAPKPKVKQAERRYLRIEEIDALLGAAKNDQVRLMLEVLLKTGIRPGEAKGLKVKDLDTDRRRLAIRRDVDDLGRIDETKTRQHRDVPISQLTTLLLEEVAQDKDPESFLLPDEYGHVWTTARWRVVWENLLADAGLESTLHTYELRHTAVSLAIAGGASVYVVQRMCGHASAATTLKYYGHLWDEGLNDASDAVEAHLEAERKRVERAQARRVSRVVANGQRHLRVVE